jgi:cytochrome bd-type quinol oxidase subunit 2
VSLGVFALLFVGGASMIAIWTRNRLAGRSPESLRGALIHSGIALVVCQLVSPALSSLLTATGHPQLRLLAVIGVALPALCYGLLATIWLIESIQSAIRRGRFS